MANYSANQQVQSARNDALSAERIRQRGFDQEANALNTQSQDRYQNFEGQQGQKASELTDFFQGQTVAPPGTADALPPSSSNITVQEENKQRAAASADVAKSAAALGDLRSFGDLLGGIGRGQARDAGLIGQIGGFKQGSSGVVPLELDEANQKGDGLKLFGDLLGGAGSVGLSAGLSGGSFGNLFKPAAAKVAAKAIDPVGLGMKAGGGLLSLFPGGR